MTELPRRLPPLTIRLAFVAFVGCGNGKRKDPIEQVQREVERLCQTTKLDVLPTVSERGTVLGCEPYVDHGDWRASAQLGLDPDRGVSIAVSLDGQVELDTLRRQAIAVVAPLLDHRQRDAVAGVLGGLQHATDHERPEPPEMRIDNARISGYVAIDREGPWLRYLDLRVVLPRPNQRERPDVLPGRGSGLGPGIATVDDRAIAAWKELCRDDDEIHDLLGYRPMSPDEQAAWATGDTERWELGDLWIRCQVLHAGERKERKYGLPMGIVATWDPATHRLVYLQIAASDLERAGGALALLKRVLTPVLDPTRRACVLRYAESGLDAEIPSRCDDIEVRRDLEADKVWRFRLTAAP